MGQGQGGERHTVFGRPPIAHTAVHDVKHAAHHVERIRLVHIGAHLHSPRHAVHWIELGSCYYSPAVTFSQERRSCQ